MSTHVVAVRGLFLRSEPRVRKGNEQAVLPEFTPVNVVARTNADWWEVTGQLSGVPFRGFVAHRHLATAAAHPAPTAAPVGNQIPEAHYGENDARVTRTQPAGARPLGEPGVPRRSAAAASIPFFRRFIDWAKVDDNRHLRWRPGNNRTYCNIYTHDFCYAAGIYLPRVWWKPDALRRLRKGETVEVAYDRTVREMNANSLHDWLIDEGNDFGWQRTFSLDTLQDKANRGYVAAICAARKDPNRSGHITMVIPENGEKAARVGGHVTRPLQSQAGSSNFRLGTGSRPWWAGDQFRSFVFCFNERPSRWP